MVGRNRAGGSFGFDFDWMGVMVAVGARRHSLKLIHCAESDVTPSMHRLHRQPAKQYQSLEVKTTAAGKETREAPRRVV